MKFFALLPFLIAAAASGAPLKVVTTTTDLAWAAREIGGSLVSVRALLKGTENPHYVDTIPNFIRDAADAQVVVVVGLDLEVGWMPKVLARSGNASVQPGGQGYCDASRTVTVLEKPTGPVDRSMGDVHPFGNSHYWLSPRTLGEAAVAIAETLSRVDPANTGTYRTGLETLRKKLDAMVVEGKKRLAKINAPLFLEYHKEFTYLFDTYGLKSMGSIEEKPGIPPSAGRLAEVALGAKSAGVTAALAGENAPKTALTRFTELSGVRVITVPTSVQPGNAKVDDYEKLQRVILDAILRK